MSSRLSSLLVQDGLVSAKRVADAFQRQVIYGGTLDSNLLELKAVDEDDLINYLGRADGLPTQPTGIHAAGEPSPEVLQVFTREVAERFRAVPTALLPGGILRVLVADGVEITEMDALALEVQQRIEPWIVLEFRFVEAMERVYGVSVPSRYSRLLTRSNTAHQTKGWPAPRPIDPIPRFGSMSNLRLVPEPLPGQLSQAKFPIPAIPDAVEQTTQTTIPEQTTQLATPEQTTQTTIPEQTTQLATSEQTTQTAIPEQTTPATTPEPTIQLDTPDLSIQMEVPSADAQAAKSDATVQMATPEPTLQQSIPESTIELSLPTSPTIELLVPEPAQPQAAPPMLVPEAASPATASEPTPSSPAPTEVVVAAAVVAAPAIAATAAPPPTQAETSGVELRPTVMFDPNRLGGKRPGVEEISSPTASIRTVEPSSGIPDVPAIDELTVADWMSAADWLSVANKVDGEPGKASSLSPSRVSRPPQQAPVVVAPTVEAMATSKPADASPAVAVPVPAVLASEPKPAAHVPTATEPSSAPAATTVKPAGTVATAAPVAQRSAASPQDLDGSRRGKRKKGREQAAQAAKPVAAPVVSAAAKQPTAPVTAPVAAAPTATRPVVPTPVAHVAAAAPTPKAVGAPTSAAPATTTQPVSNKPVQQAAQPKPAQQNQQRSGKPGAPANVAQGKPASTQQTTPATIAVTPAAQVSPALPAKAVPVPPPAAAAPVSAAQLAEPPLPTEPRQSEPRPVEPLRQPVPLAAAAPAPAATSDKTPVSAPPTFAEAAPAAAAPEPIPEVINSGRLGERIVSAPAIAVVKAEPPASAQTPAGEIAGPIRPAPRVAMALDVYGSSPLSPEAARELIESVTDRGVLFDLLCRGIRSRVAFAAVFTIHGDVAFGRTALGTEFFDRTQLGRISVQLDRTSPFRVAAKERTAYVGRVGEQAASAEPLRAMNRTTPVEGAILPIQLKGRAVALLYLDDDGYALASDLVDDVRALMNDVGQALSRIQQQSKSGGLGVSIDGNVGEEVREGGTSGWRAPSSKSPALESQATPLPPAKPASDSPVPVLLADQATQPLHTTPAPKESAVPAAVAAQPTVPLGKSAAPAGNSSQKAKPTSPAAKAPQQADATAAKAPETKAAAVPPSTSSPAKSDLAALVERAGNKDEAAVSLLLEGGLEAARAVVAALPGPLRSNDRQALGDPVGGPVWSRGPLLGLVLRIGHIAVEPILERLKDTSLPAETRYHLTLCLGEMPLPSTVVPLGQLLFDGDETVRMAAVTALRNFPPSAELSTLISQLRDTIDSNDNRRAHHAIEAVGELRVTSAVMQLINLLDTDDSALIDAIGRALQTITKQDFGQSRIRWTSWWRRRQDEPRLQWLLEGLAHPSAMLRSAAQDELTSLSGDVVGYRFDQPRRERDQLRKRWAQWWQRRGYPVN